MRQSRANACGFESFCSTSRSFGFRFSDLAIGRGKRYNSAGNAPKVVEVLLRRGADVNSRNLKADSEFAGATPLIMNATQKDDCAEVTELLIGAGADVDAVDAAGKCALDYAVEYERGWIEAVLRRHVRN